MLQALGRPRRGDGGATWALSLAAAVALTGPALPAFGQTIVLYQNNFEMPNVPLVKDCGDALDQRGIQFLYGTPGITFQQQFTVEVVLIKDPVYTNPPPGIG